MQYKFQGKSLQTNEWLIGSHLKISGKDYIIPVNIELLEQKYAGDYIKIEPAFEVHPDSVGMWTGQLDIHEKEIYSGDIVKITDEYMDEYIHEVKFDKGGYFFAVSWDFKPSFDEDLDFEIIGNSFTSPELLNKKT